MEAFLKFILILIILYYGFRLFIRYALPWIIARFVRKQQEKFNNMSGFDNSSRTNQSNKDVKYKTSRKTPPKEDDDFGEYVDFEEVKE